MPSVHASVIFTMGVLCDYATTTPECALMVWFPVLATFALPLFKGYKTILGSGGVLCVFVCVCARTGTHVRVHACMRAHVFLCAA